LDEVFKRALVASVYGVKESLGLGDNWELSIMLAKMEL
jgi:hypothetical protein